MSEICIEVKSVDLVKATTKTNKPYEFVDLMYKNKSFQDKVEGKKVMPFGNKEVFDVLKNSEKGDVFFIGRTKNADGFWDWDKISAESNSHKQVEEVGHPISKSPVGKSVSSGSNWETAEDRAKKQVYIIRQSSLTNAVNTLVGNVNPDDVKVTAQTYINFVLGIDDPDVTEDDIPY